MDTTMLKGNSVQALMQLVRRMFLEIHTCLPGEIVSFNPDTQTATVKGCIRNKVIDTDGNVTWIDPPRILEVPVVFLQSQKNGFSITYPVQAGDQCLLFFSERGYDNWLEYGSVQNPNEIGAPLAHQYNDAFALVGVSPYPSSIQNFQTDCIELRNKNRDIRISLSDSSIVVHNNKVEVILNEDNFITKLEDGQGKTIASIEIDKDGNINLKSNKDINVDGDNVNITGNTVNCFGGDINVIGTNTLTVESPIINIKAEKGVLIDGELYAKTYLVGPDPDQTVGVIAGEDKNIERTPAFPLRTNEDQDA